MYSAAKMIPPGQSASGFAYFQVPQASAEASVYISGLEDAASGKTLHTLAGHRHRVPHHDEGGLMLADQGGDGLEVLWGSGPDRSHRHGHPPVVIRDRHPDASVPEVQSKGPPLFDRGVRSPIAEPLAAQGELPPRTPRQ